ncbi:MAG: mucoidy inhibitor MuiA family protein [Saprospiraceae bacterium]|nr:mucoidy inhibitor MuiA family protein [Saprospiraceae bacterium]
MKRIFFAILLLLQLSPSVFFAQNEKTVKTTVQRATVFQQGALLTSTESISIGQGTTNIVFENVSPYLQQNSLQASGKNDLIVMDVQYRLKYAEQTKTDAKPDDPKVARWQTELRAAQDSLDDLNFVKKDIQNRTQTLQMERNVLVNNRLMRGDMQRDSLALFMQSIDFLRKRQNDIDSELLKLEKESYKENRLRQQLNTRIATLNNLIQGIGTPQNNSPTKPVPQVIVTVMTDKATTAELTLTYFVPQAGWTASYDLRASKEAQTIDLKHRAAVYQNTGIDWKDVLLTLSTGDPNQSNTKPTLTPQYLVYNMPIIMQTEAVYAKQRAKMAAPQAQNYQNMNINNGVAAADLAKEDRDEAEKPTMERDGVMDFTQINQNMMRIEYEIKLKYTIESDNKAHNVVIQNKTMPAVYSYSVVPKLDPDAFLMARVTDWEDMNLIAGSARIYFDNSYIGESYINPRNTNDTLQLNLGRDKSIVVTRTKVKDKCKDKVLSDNHIMTQVYDITLRNTKNIPIRLVVEDQMPVTKEQDIKIEYLENSGARFNTETGKLVWDFTLKPKDTKKLTFSYEIKSPKDKSLSSL